MRYVFLVVSLLFCINLSAQQQKVVLHGTISMATGESFPYRIEVTENNGTITGFAYTYDERDEAKAIIKGKIDRQNRKLTFRETEIVTSSLVVTKAYMCMVQATLERRSGKLSGPAVNKQADNTVCTDGTITFSNNNEIEDLFATHDKFDVAVEMGSKKAAPAPQPAPAPVIAGDDPVSTDKITAGVEKSFTWLTDSVVMEVWDGGMFDGDMVTILFDDKPVVNHYVIQKQKKRVVVRLPAMGSHTVAIVADGEGSDPPNTATFMLYDGATKYNVIAYNKKGERSLIRIQRLRQ